MSDAETPQDSAATPDLEGPMCYGFTRDGVWLDTYYGWVIPNEAVADVGEAGPTIERDSQRSAARPLHRVVMPTTGDGDDF